MHCLATAVTLALLASAGGLLGSPWIHEVGLSLAMMLGAVALGRGVLEHGFMMPSAVGGLGLGVMAGALTLPHDGNEALFALDVDVLIPAALENQITEDNAPSIPHTSAASSERTAVTMSCHRRTIRMGLSPGLKGMRREAKTLGLYRLGRWSVKSHCSAAIVPPADSAPPEPRHQPLQLVQARVVDDHRALAALAVGREPRLIEEHVLQPPVS